MNTSVIAIVPKDLDTQNLTLPMEMIKTGISVIREDDKIIFSGVRTSQRKTIIEYVVSAGLEFDAVASFWLL